MTAKVKLVVVGYPHQWHWVLSAEYALQNPGHKVHVLDLSNLGFLSFQNPNLPFSKNWRFRRQAIKFLSSNGVTFSSPKFDLIDQIRSLYLAIFSDYPDLIDENIAEFASIYPSLVNLLDDTQIITREHLMPVILENSKAKLIHRRLNKYGFENIDSITTVNGRFTNNFEVRKFAEKCSLPITFVEFGSSKESIEEYFISPHSFSELGSKMMSRWTGAEFQREVGHQFFQELSNYDRNAGVSWTSKMKPGETPLIQEGFKICVFYASSQKEFIGVGDPHNPAHFKSQFEAFRTLHEYLIDQNWYFFIRRHPVLNSKSKDSDGKYWEEFLNFKNVKILEPDSAVDSYALGEMADLVAHYNSSVGIQLIYRGHKSVMSMGNPMWADLTPGTLARNKKEIIEFFLAPTKDWSSDSVLPWGYFRASFGQKFKYFEFVRESTTWKLMQKFN